MPKAVNNYTARYSEKALSQYNKAASWYRERSFSAADNFIASVEARVKLIKEYPFRYRKPYKSFYEISVRKYPYQIIYLIDESSKQIIIVSIHHHKQNPKRKYRR